MNPQIYSGVNEANTLSFFCFPQKVIFLFIVDIMGDRLLQNGDYGYRILIFFLIRTNNRKPLFRN